MSPVGLMLYRPRNESTYTFKLDSARSEHGWKVFASQPASTSKVWMLASTALLSMPERPPPSFALK